jgi:hypothetical protein
MDESDTGPHGYDRGGELEQWARSIAATEAIRRENEKPVFMLGDSWAEGGTVLDGMLAEQMHRDANDPVDEDA